MKKVLAALLISAGTIFSSSAYAQVDADMQVGVNASNSYHSGQIDTVNLFNGNVTLKIPLISLPQRGSRLKLDYQLVYNGKGIGLQQYCTPAGMGTPAECEVAWGSRLTGLPVGSMTDTDYRWALNDSQDITYTAGEYHYSTGTPPHLVAHVSYFADWITADGGSHAGMPFNDGYGAENIQRSIDGSGLVLGLSQTNSSVACSHFCYVRDSLGNAYYPSGYPTSGSNVIREDTNGNEITAVYSGTTRVSTTDTVGRVIDEPVETDDYTSCTGPYPIVGAKTFTVAGYGTGTSIVYKLCFADSPINIPDTDEADGVSGSQEVLQSIVLPNNQAWTFEYSDRNPGDDPSVNYGDLTKVTFPTGGIIEYSYQSQLGYGPGFDSMHVVSRTEIVGSQTNEWDYTYQTTSPGAQTYQTIVTAPLLPGATVRNDTVHNWVGLASASIPIESSVIDYAGTYTSGTIIKEVDTSYGSWTGNKADGGDKQGYFPQTVTTTLGSTVMKKVMTYGDTFGPSAFDGTGASNNNFGTVTDAKIYDYGSGSPGSLLREEIPTYLFETSSSYLNENLVSLASVAKVLDPSGSTVSETDSTYDESSYLTSSGISTQHVTSPVSYPGNLTTSAAWLSGGTSPQTHTNWYDTGEPHQTTDARGNHASTILYSSTYAGSLPTTVTNALSQSSTFVYDFNLGSKTSATDANSQTTTWGFDALGRTTSITRPSVYPGTSTHSHATICYDDTAGECLSDSPLNAVLVTEAVTPTVNVQEEEEVDGFGRKSLSRLVTDPDGTTYGLTTYDSQGHVYQSWNPSRCALSSSTTSCTGEGTFGITTHYYDAVNREVLTVPPDGSVSSNNVQTTFTGNQTTVVDQAGISHTSTVDALGRLIKVSEDNPGWITQYTYDTMGNLLCAEQHGGVSGTGCSSSPASDATSPWRVRRFTYDTLSRLLTATNPETGTITYAYDANNNVVSKTDGRGVEINYNPTASPIDALNRVTMKTYPTLGDGTVTYFYDSTSVANGIGRRTGMTDETGSTAWTYDPDGRVTVEDKTFNNLGTPVEKQLTTSYNLLGSPYEIDYPTGQQVRYTVLGAGRVTDATDHATGEVYATGLQYSPAGAVVQATYGANETPGISIQNHYNQRLQPVVLSASAGVNTLMSRTYDFGIGTNDNGSVRGIVNNVDSTRNQSFTYDGVNRLLTAQTPSTWGVQFTYDAWGNMTQTSGIAGTSLTNPMPEPLDRASNYQNQLTSSIVTYGYAPTGGNMTSDPSGGGYTYDSENRIFAAGGVFYGYDGDGFRVSKYPGTVYWFGGLIETDWSGTAKEVYIGVGGQKVARIDASTGQPYYYLTDMLGSSSVVATATGVVDSESDFYPFGGERVITATSSSEHYKFTGKERDGETGNDYFGARFYSSTLGRFLSPDWAAKAEPIPYAKLGNPQSLNLYAYVQGDVESSSDHDGHDKIPLPGAKNALQATMMAIMMGLPPGSFTIVSQPDAPTAAAEPASTTTGTAGTPGQNTSGANGGTPTSGTAGTGGAQQQSSSPSVTDRALTTVANAADTLGMNTPGMQSAIDHIGTFVAGAGDFLSFGITKKINDADGGSAFIDYGSSTYTAGKVTGIGLTVATAVAGTMTAAAVADGKTGAYFGRGTNTVFNGRPGGATVRFGWGWNQNLGEAGKDIIRLGIGPARGTSWWSHITFYVP